MGIILAPFLAGVGSDDDSDIVVRRGVVLYDFSPEEEDEVAVTKGEALDVAYEVGGWLQVSLRTWRTGSALQRTWVVAARGG